MSYSSIYQTYFKRFADLFFSLALLIVLSPVFLLVSVLIMIFMGRPVLFKQERPGFHEKPFTLLKFRTMGFQREISGELSSDMTRLTPLGKFLRRFSLDELPQLINIALGQMSFIGPRPLLMEYLPLYSTEQRKRHDVLPGITGWAQVQGRNQMSWDDRFDCDLWYVQNLSFVLDIKITSLTIIKVISGSGVNAENGVTMTKFTGKKS
jgi:lipopolysaccharide/colanic/teichoic acid biosynthesis glycosyltransferase